MAQTTELRQRLTSILDPNQRRRSGGTRGAAVAVLSCTAALLLVSTWQPVPTSILAFPVERAQAATPDPHLPTLVHYGQTLDRALADVENNPEIAHDVAFLMLRIKEFFLTGETFQIETMHLNSLAAEARYHELKRLYRDDLRARLDQSIPELLVRGLGPGAMRDEAERYLASNNDTDLYLLLLRSRDEFVSSFYRPYNFFSPSPSLGMKTPTLGGVAALALVVSGEDVVKDLVSIYESGHGPETKNARWALRNLIWPEQRELADRLLSEL